ncbi:MAG: aspartate carbamoyltransferase [Candidatus Tectimicrobiota bacterium]
MTRESSRWLTNIRHPRSIAGIALLAVSAVFSVVPSVGGGASPKRQEEIATKGAQVMPFDLDQTMHHFQPLEDGGLQMVTVKDPANSPQVALIQAHLQEEADKFRRGDFSDPATIHGANMPGLATLQAGAQRIDIQYTALPNGAQIRYTTKDAALIMALHQWFAAQLADHGHHAVHH